jgi:hypothetical protein
MGLENVDWINVTESRDRRRAFANTVMNLLPPEKTGRFLTISAYYLLAFQEGLCFHGASWLVSSETRCPAIHAVYAYQNN